ncbi:MAG: hypothetical protein ACOX0U_04470 [Oscillospiraceae bacterium]|jgi:hypothetical protein
MVLIDVANEYNSYIELSNSASEALDFQSFLFSFFAAEHSLGLLAEAPVGDLVRAGLGDMNFGSLFRDLQLRRDIIFNQAIKRSYDRELEVAALMSSERGRRSAMDRWLQVVVASQALSPVNYNYLKELFNQP